MNKKIFFLTIIGVLLDQVIKLMVSHWMVLGKSIKVIKDFFSLTYVQNTGAAFSILSGNIYLLIGITVIALFLIYFLLIKDKNLTKIDAVLYSLLLSGIFGNFIDRVFRGYVVDYLDFNIFGYDFAIFNLADIMIVVSIGILFLMTFKKEK